MEGSGREGLRRSLSHALSPQEVGADGASRPACASHPEVFTSPCLQAGLSLPQFSLVAASRVSLLLLKAGAQFRFLTPLLSILLTA